MAFNARPILEDISFRQLTGSELTLSGSTNFVGTLQSKGVEIDASTGGTSNGYVLTLLSGKIQLSPASSATDVTFDSDRLTTRSGIPSVNVSGTTVKEFLEGYFFPSVPPVATLNVSTGGSNREYGNSTVGNLSWVATRETNPLDTIEVDTNGDGTYNSGDLEDGSGASQSGTIGYTVLSTNYSPATGSTSNSQIYRLRVISSTGEVDIDTSLIQWRHKKWYLGESNSLSSSDAATFQTILNTGGATGTLTTSRSLNISITLSNEYFYYLYPKQFGAPSSITVNGLPNNAWGNVGNGTLFEITYTNIYSYSETFYVVKSDNRITGTFSVVIT